MRDGGCAFFMGMGGNFVSATPDTAVVEAGMRNVDLTVQVSTKLNRSHVVTGRRALILPTLGRTDRDKPRRGRAAGVGRGLDGRGALLARAAGAAVRRPAERGRDRRAAVRAGVRLDATPRLPEPAGTGSPGSRGDRPRRRSSGRPAQEASGPDPAIVDHPLNAPHADWAALEADYALIRAHIENVVPGLRRLREAHRQGRDAVPAERSARCPRASPRRDGKARFTVNPLEYPRIPRGRLLLQTLRSHDQYNTTIYGKDDRYRGIRGGRRVVMVNAKDIQALGFEEDDVVDLVSEWVGPDGVVAGAARGGVPHRRVPDAAGQRRGVLPRDERPGAAGLGRRRQRHADLEVGRRPAGARAASRSVALVGVAGSVRSSPPRTPRTGCKAWPRHPVAT